MIIEIGLYIALNVGIALFVSDKRGEAGKTKGSAPKDVAPAPPQDANGLAGYSGGIEFQEEYYSEKYCDHYIGAGAATAIASALGYLVSPLFRPVAFVLFAYTAYPYNERGITQLIKGKKITMDLLLAISSLLGGVLSGQYLVIGLFDVVYFYGKKVLTQTRNNFSAKLYTLYDNHMELVLTLREGREIFVPFRDVALADVVIVKTGQTIPFDGEITAGMALVDQKILTGESQPVEKVAGDAVYAATHLVSGLLHIRVLKSGQDTAIEKVAHILNRSVDMKTRLQSRSDKLADQSSLPVFITGCLSLPLYGVSSAAAVFASSPGYEMNVFSPLAILRYIDIAAKHGILVKDGRAIEALGDVDTVIFDKTGTLTADHLDVGDIFAFHGYGEDEVIYYAALAEQQMNHPIAAAIKRKALERDQPVPKIDLSNYRIGFGITVLHENVTIRIGSRRFMETENIPLPVELEGISGEIGGRGNSLLCLAIAERIVGILEIRSTVRKEARRIVDDLKRRGIREIAIISGDHENATRRIAADLGIARYYCDIVPQDKASIIAGYQRSGHRVCFIGDGINDTLAMKQADVSVSLTGASTIAQDIAQVILLDGDLDSLGHFFEISRRLKTNQGSSYALSVVPSFLTIGGVLFCGMGFAASQVLFQTIFIAGLANSRGLFEKQYNETRN